MKKVYSTQLLRKIHLANYVYYNEEQNELYVWFNGPEVKIFDYLGEEIGNANIINGVTKEEYKITDGVKLADAMVTVDTLVNSTN